MKGGTAIALVVLLVCSVLILGSIYAYQSMPVEVQIGERVICTDPQHQGNRVLEDNVQTIKVPRRETGKYRVTEKQIVCQTCQARREEEERQAKIRREREEREARERAEVEEIMRNLRVKFGLGAPTIILDPSYIRQEASMKAGDEIDFWLYIQNDSPKPIDASVKIVIEPGKYLELRGYPIGYPGGLSAKDVEEMKAKLRRLTTTGWQVCEKILPYDSPYYPKSWAVHWSSSWHALHDLCLSRNVQPGQDIHFNGYIITKNHKIPVGTVIVHVMYPE